MRAGEARTQKKKRDAGGETSVVCVVYRFLPHFTASTHTHTLLGYFSALRCGVVVVVFVEAAAAASGDEA